MKQGSGGSGARLSPALFVGGLLLAAMIVAGGALFFFDLPVQDEGEDLESPEMAFAVNETRDHARVNATQGNLSWGEFQVQMDKKGEFWLVGEENRTRGEPLVFTQVENKSWVREGARIRFCLNTGGEDVNVEVRHRLTGEVVGSFRISDVAPCAPPEPPEPTPGAEDNATGEEGPDNGIPREEASQGDAQEPVQDR